MTEASDKIQEILTNNTAVTAIVGDKIYWELGKDGDDVPLINYTITQELGPSKDRNNYSAVIRCFGGDMLASANINTAVQAAMKAANQTFQGAQSGLTDDEQREAVILINYNINL